jgi:4-carboxymuconolactone decarboxylase/cardiolipin synthase
MHDDGSLAGPFNALLLAPGIGNAVQELGAALRFKGALPARTRELVICAVAAALNSEYEWYAHSRAAVVVGVSEEELAQLQAGTVPTGASDSETAALELTRELVAEAGVKEDIHAEAQKHFGPAGVAELAILVGYYRTLAGLLAVADVQAPVDIAPEEGHHQ